MKFKNYLKNIGVQIRLSDDDMKNVDVHKYSRFDMVISESASIMEGVKVIGEKVDDVSVCVSKSKALSNNEMVKI